MLRRIIASDLRAYTIETSNNIDMNVFVSHYMDAGFISFIIA